MSRVLSTNGCATGIKMAKRTALGLGTLSHLGVGCLFAENHSRLGHCVLVLVEAGCSITRNLDYGSCDPFPSPWPKSHSWCCEPEIIKRSCPSAIPRRASRHCQSVTMGRVRASATLIAFRTQPRQGKSAVSPRQTSRSVDLGLIQTNDGTRVFDVRRPGSVQAMVLQNPAAVWCRGLFM